MRRHTAAWIATAASTAAVPPKVKDWFTSHPLPDTPFVLFAASAQDAAEELARAQRWGVHSWCTHTSAGPALARLAETPRNEC